MDENGQRPQTLVLGAAGRPDQSLERQDCRPGAAPGARRPFTRPEGHAVSTVRGRTDHAPPKQTSPQGAQAPHYRRADPRLGGRAPPPHGPLAPDGLRPRHGRAARRDLARAGQRPAPGLPRPAGRLVAGPAPRRAPPRPQPLPAASAQPAAGPRLGGCPAEADGRLADVPIRAGRRRRGGDVAGPGLGPARRTAWAAGRLVAGPAAGRAARRPQPAGSAAADPGAGPGLGRRSPPPHRGVAERRPPSQSRRARAKPGRAWTRPCASDCAGCRAARRWPGCWPSSAASATPRNCPA